LRLIRRDLERDWVAVCVALLVACSRSAPGPKTSAADSSAIACGAPRATADTTYRRELVKYCHDVAVIDSLTRAARRDPLLQQDSIYKIYRTALRREPLSDADLNRLQCLEETITLRYGLVAGFRVLDELRDTVFRDQGIDNPKDAVNFFWNRGPSSGVLDSDNCTQPRPVHSSEVDGVRIDENPTPPHLNPAGAER
jgi:hypothetical protein